MIANLPTMFWIGLLLKIALTASIVVTASVAVERSGPFIGALIAALPTAGGAAMIILGFEHDAHFISQGAVGGIVANAICPIFALTYAALAQRNSLAVSLGGALLVWLTGALASQVVAWTVWTALLANALVYPFTIYLASYFTGEGAARGKVILTARDIAMRAAIVAVCIVIVTAAGTTIGPYLSGVFALIPVAMSSFFIILHPRLGGPAAASVAAHVQAPLIGLTLGLLPVHFLAEVIGVWWSYLLGLSFCVAWNGLVWTWKNRRG